VLRLCWIVVEVPDNLEMHISLTHEIPNIAKLCERFGVTQLELFGSAAGDEFDSTKSDFDFLVQLDPTAPGSRARRWTELADELEKLLGSRVDLVNPKYIRNPYFRESVDKSRTLIYDRAHP
jgi:uncharacterized protein